jgi:amino acid adenylation domain-containing protein
MSDTAATLATGEAANSAGSLLHAGFLRSAERFAARPALEVGGETLTYAALRDRASAIASGLDRHRAPNETAITAVFAYRTPTAYAGVLAALLRGDGYVALNRRFPPDRTRLMLSRSEASAIVVDEGSAAQLEEVLRGLDRPLVVLLADTNDVTALRRRWPHHTVLSARDLDGSKAWTPAAGSPDSTAYLMFTSGSTGTPKGVHVLHRTARRYIDIVAERWNISEVDRTSQTFDMTFDLSVSDMFSTWDRGACLCCPAAEIVARPAKFIRESQLTVWFSVPSVGLVMKRLGMLKPDSYPTLRLSLFCGEPLPLELAEAWSRAAPNSKIENVYGPTEVTVACTAYEFDSKRAVAESEQGVVPIGWPFPGMSTRIVDDKLQDVPMGEIGELLLTGPQLSAGYWRDREKTEAAFINIDGDDRVYYRTGDRVRQRSADAPVTYLGRVDHQVKISGHRVELGEIEAVLRQETGRDEVVALGWPRIETGYAAVAAFVCAPDVDGPAVQRALARRLPDYMVPREIRALPEIPLNVNGKFDRKALVQMLDEGR